MTGSSTLSVLTSQIDAACEQLAIDIPGTTRRHLPDGRTYLMLVTPDARSSLRVDGRNLRHDVFVLYQVVNNGNGRDSMRFVGWAPQATVQAAMVKRRTMITVPYKVLSSLEALRVPVVKEKSERRVVSERGFEGQVYTYTWGWRDKSVKVKRDDVVLDLFYEANGAAYSFFTGKKFKSLAAAIDAVKDPARMVQPAIIDRTRSWEIDHRKKKASPARKQAQTSRYQSQARERKDWE